MREKRSNRFVVRLTQTERAGLSRLADMDALSEAAMVRRLVCRALRQADYDQKLFDLDMPLRDPSGKSVVQSLDEASRLAFPTPVPERGTYDSPPAGGLQWNISAELARDLLDELRARRAAREVGSDTVLLPSNGNEQSE